MADYEIADIYTGLRNRLLEARPVSPPGRSADDLWAIMMETGYPTAVATLLAASDGTVSLYFSNGGGFIGMGAQAGPRAAGRALLELAPQFLSHCQVTAEYPLPLKQHTRFYLIGYDGVRTAEALDDDLGNSRHALSPLFHAAHRLIAEIRMMDQKRKAKGATEAGGSKPQ